MPFPPFAPSAFFDEADIDTLAAEFSERVRRSPQLRPVMDGLVGNRWEDAEATMGAFLRATLFLQERPEVNGDWLARAVRMLDDKAIDLLADILLDCALVALPLHSAAVISEISEQLARLLKSVAAEDGVAQQRLVLRACVRLSGGAPDEPVLVQVGARPLHGGCGGRRRRGRQIVRLAAARWIANQAPTMMTQIGSAGNVIRDRMTTVRGAHWPALAVT